MAYTYIKKTVFSIRKQELSKAMRKQTMSGGLRQDPGPMSVEGFPD